MSIAKLLIIDTEVDHKGKIQTLGLIDEAGNNLYKGENPTALLNYLEKYDIVVGHNIFKHDLNFLLQVKDMPISLYQKPIIDTLWLSSLIFIKYPYHALIKDYKLDKINDPIQDAKLCLELFQACVAEFLTFPASLQNLLYALVWERDQFRSFFAYLAQKQLFIPQKIAVKSEIRAQFSWVLEEVFFEKELEDFLQTASVELAYVLRLLLIKMQIDKDISVLPAWIVQNLPKVSEILATMLKYKIYNPKRELKRYFWYDNFRNFTSASGGSVSQQEVVEAALKGEDLLAIFSTWWGKSLTFQLPALMIADQMPYLTLVISPLQSLMKDQVDVLNNRHHITNVGYLNATLNPLERKEVCQKVEFGGIDLLYLSPEMLRSRSTINLLSKRLIARVVIDEAHCFSKWGHDFRIDYMFIADFIKELQKKNQSLTSVKISCFTATGKRDVTEEIQSYFKTRLWSNLKEFRSTSARSNLSYQCIKVQDEEQRFTQLIELLENKVQSQPCIIFTRYTGAWSENDHGAENLSKKINESLWYQFCSYYHGKMPSEQKRKIQDDFIAGRISTIVATNAFGMGVDKEDVRFVIHYGIPSSLENYLQEAGRAGRDGKDSDCIMLYNSEDVTANIQLNKLGEVKSKEIKSLLSSLKKSFAYSRDEQDGICRSAKTLVRAAGWLGTEDFDNNYRENKPLHETKVKTALFFLEKFWFIKRGFNRTKVRATANKNATLREQFKHIDQLFWSFLTAFELEKIKEIYKHIKSSKVIAIEDINVGLPLYDEGGTKWVTTLVDLLRGQNFIENDDEITLILNPDKLISTEALSFTRQAGEAVFSYIEHHSYQNSTQLFEGQEVLYDKYKMNTALSDHFGATTLMHEIEQLFHLFVKRKKIQIAQNRILFLCDFSDLKNDFRQLVDRAEQFLHFLLQSDYSTAQKSNHNLTFVQKLGRLNSLFTRYLWAFSNLVELENLLKFLHLFEIVRIEGGLFLYQTKFQLKRWENLDQNFKKEHYSDLFSFYQKKNEQAHIMDHFARNLVGESFSGHQKAIDTFIDDYFSMEYEDFLNLYFKNKREELKRPLSKEKYQQIYNSLSPEQAQILKAKDNLLLIAGPGAGKTKSLVHKVASLILEDGVRSQEFLLLTFSRSAKFELKKRIIDLLGPQGYFLQIHTFHSFSFDLLEMQASPELFDDGDFSIIEQACNYLKENPNLQLPYSILILDEFQDINDQQFELISLIKQHASKGEEMRAVAAGDDDQSIFGFAGGNIKHIQEFKNTFNAKEIILTANYRSTQKLINFTSSFIQLNSERIKRQTQLVSKVSEQTSLFDQGMQETKIQTINLNQDQVLNFLPRLFENDILQGAITRNQSIVILFHNNETGLVIDHLLKQQGYQTKLLLEKMGYKLEQTLEFSAFLKSYSNENDPVNKDNINAKLERIIAIYGDNKTTKLLGIFVQTLIDQNKILNLKIVQDAIRGISEQDLLRNQDAQIVLSTFHKAKGLEFENVIICFDEDVKRNEKRNLPKAKKEELVRLLYVAMTRAKRNLFILWNQASNPFFEFLSRNALECLTPQQENKTKKEIWLITSCKDIFLSYHDRVPVSPEDAFPIDTPIRFSFDSNGGVRFTAQWSILQLSSKHFWSKLKSRLEKGYLVKSIHLHQRLWYYLKDKDKCVVVYLFSIILSQEGSK